VATEEDRELDLAAALGAENEDSTQVLPLYIPNKDRQHVGALREFVHRFGRETNQEVVVVELSGAEGSWFFRIKEYDE
jgi:hypothetical protein